MESLLASFSLQETSQLRLHSLGGTKGYFKRQTLFLILKSKKTLVQIIIIFSQRSWEMRFSFFFLVDQWLYASNSSWINLFKDLKYVTSSLLRIYSNSWVCGFKGKHCGAEVGTRAAFSVIDLFIFFLIILGKYVLVRLKWDPWDHSSCRYFNCNEIMQH